MNFYLILGIALLILNARNIYITEINGGGMNWWSVISGSFSVALILMSL